MLCRIDLFYIRASERSRIHVGLVLEERNARERSDRAWEGLGGGAWQSSEIFALCVSKQAP